MENKQISMLDLLLETHIGLERQGPGSAEMTIKALSFLDNPDAISRIADLGCGTGSQTMVLAQKLNGNIVALDQFPVFIDVLSEKAKGLKLQDRVTGLVGSMDELFFGEEEFDLIWSEGAIDNIGFKKGLNYWNGFLKKGGYVAVTCPSWFTEEHPAEVEKFWADAGSGLDAVEDNIETMQKCGYSFVAAFALPENCWTNNYFVPRETAGKKLLEKYGDNKVAKDYTEGDKYEVELYSKYKQHYGYAFYIGKKI